MQRSSLFVDGAPGRSWRCAGVFFSWTKTKTKRSPQSSLGTEVTHRGNGRAHGYLAFGGGTNAAVES